MCMKKKRKPKVPQIAVVQCYNIAKMLLDMLNMLPDTDLAMAKREMHVVEDLLWQAVDDRRRL